MIRSDWIMDVEGRVETTFWWIRYGYEEKGLMYSRLNGYFSQE